MPPTAAAVAYAADITDARDWSAPDGAVYRCREDEDGCIRIVQCLACPAETRIPDSIDGRAVVAIDDYAFSGSHSIQRLYCPSRLRSIGTRTFENCMNLSEVSFNDRLESIGAEAFFLCQALSVLELPVSLKKLGANIAGAQNMSTLMMRSTAAPLRTAEIRIPANSPYLATEPNGLIYEKTEDGLVLIDGSRFEGSVLEPLSGTIAIGAEALAQNRHIVEAILPHGCKRIDAGAFRGCIWLSKATLPDTLEEIQRAAFSCTALRSIRIPRSCVRIHDTALATGPVIPDLPCQPYASKLLEISVEAGNPRYCMAGPVLCRRICGNQEENGAVGNADRESRCLVCSCEEGPIAEDAPLEAVICPARADEVDLTGRIVRIAPSAFAGTAAIGHLTLRADIEIADGLPLLPHASCDRLTIVAENAAGVESAPAGTETVLDLEITENAARAQVLSAPLTGPRIDMDALIAAYDRTVINETDRLAQARQMLGRLAHPVALDGQTREFFSETVRASFETICLHFGVRAYWTGFEHMAEAGFLDADGIPGIVDLLAEYGDAAAAGYLLAMKRRRFGEADWDFAI